MHKNFRVLISENKQNQRSGIPPIYRSDSKDNIFRDILTIREIYYRQRKDWWFYACVKKFYYNYNITEGRNIVKKSILIKGILFLFTAVFILSSFTAPIDADYTNTDVDTDEANQLILAVENCDDYFELIDKCDECTDWEIYCSMKCGDTDLIFPQVAYEITDICTEYCLIYICAKCSIRSFSSNHAFWTDTKKFMQLETDENEKYLKERLQQCIESEEEREKLLDEWRNKRQKYIDENY